MRVIRFILLLAGLLGLIPAIAAETRPGCDSCSIQVNNLDKPVKLVGKWLFTREDRPENKDLGLDTSSWKLAKAPGPWKKIYDDHKVFTVGWYRGAMDFAPHLVGKEVVMLVNTYMARTRVFVDGEEVYERPQNMNVERYYSVQAIPVRFKVSKAHHEIAIRVDTPLMTGIYQLPFELHEYNQHDKSLVMFQIWGGEARAIAAYVMLLFGFFFLLVYAKTRYSLYLVAALAGIFTFPFFAAPGDYFLSLIEPETMLYLHYTGIGFFFLFYLFSQYFHEFTPKTNMVMAPLQILPGIAIGFMAIHPNVELFQHLRSFLFIMALINGLFTMHMLWRGMRNRKPGAFILFASITLFMISGINDVFLALGLISSVAIIFSGAACYVAAMLYVSAQSFANTFLENKILVRDLKGMNDNLEGLVSERTAQLHEKTNDIQSMLQNMPQGVLTITRAGVIHPEYSAYLETIFETKDIANKTVMQLIFTHTNLGADALSQVETSTASVIGEDQMNFEFNSHLLVQDLEKTMPDGSVKSLALSWSPICDDNDIVDKLMVCVRDVTELKRLENEANHQKRELEMIGEILSISQEKFEEFVESSRKFIAENRELIQSTQSKNLDAINLLFRNMHTIKGNARTYGLFYVTDLVHVTEQAYDDLRKNPEVEWAPEALLTQLDAVQATVEEYAKINDTVLGRKGTSQRSSTEKVLMVDKDLVLQSMQTLASVDQNDANAMRHALAQVGHTLHLFGTERIEDILAGVIESLPSLAKELGKEMPVVYVQGSDILIRSHLSSLLKNLSTHLLRNSMDHGLEPADVRVANGKLPAGKIDIEVFMLNNKLCIKLRDDGRGIALKKIHQRAIEHELVPADKVMTQEEIAQMIFVSGFSTAERVTEVSGRGVGMDAVKGFLEKQNGTVEIQFLDNNVGADFRAFELVIKLPEHFAVKLDPTKPLPTLQSLAAATSAA